MVKVLFVLTSHSWGWYLPELAHPFFHFQSAGYDITIASISGGHAPVTSDSLNFEDLENKKFWEDENLRGLTENTKSLSEYSGLDYQVVFFVGGTGTMFDFPFDSNVDRIGREVYESGGIVAAVCHGPIALANIKLSDGSYLITGKQVAAFTDEEENDISIQDGYPDHGDGKKSCKQVLTALGAIHTQANNWQSHVVVDSRVITGQNPASKKIFFLF